MPVPAVAALLERLRPLLGERVSDAVGVRSQFGRSEAYRDPSPPDLVARQPTLGKSARSSASATSIACRSSRSAREPRSKATSPRSQGGLPRHDADGRDLSVQGRRSRLPRAARHRAARRSTRRWATPACSSRRPRRRRDARRDGGDPRLGHDGRPLRQHARQRARRSRRCSPTGGDPHRLARAQVGGGVRPDGPARRLGGDARRDHRAQAARASDAGADRRGALPLPDDRRAGRGRHRHRSASACRSRAAT